MKRGRRGNCKLAYGMASLSACMGMGMDSEPVGLLSAAVRHLVFGEPRDGDRLLVQVRLERAGGLVQQGELQSHETVRAGLYK